jgi:tetratricopeptide (TPR) repeat protein
MEQAAEAVKQGQVRMEGNQYRAAAHQFQLAVSNDDTSAEAWLGLAAAQIRLAQPQSAVGSLFKALDRAHSNTELVTQIQYNLACAYSLMGKKREAIKALREAVRLGGPDISTSLDSDPDLQSLHGEKEFATLRPRGKR